MRVHLDTDIGGDVDDLCALAMLLGWPGVEVTGITQLKNTNANSRPPTHKPTNHASERASLKLASVLGRKCT